MNPGLVAQNFSVVPLFARFRALAERDRLWLPADCPKGHCLFDQDNAPADVFCLMRGLIKLVYITPEGEERIKSFIVDQGLFAVEDDALRFGAVAIESSTLARLPMQWVKNRISEEPALQREYTDFTNWVRQRKALREQSLLCDRATERLQKMQMAEPDLLGRLPQGDIARFLGITPIAFSRIKKRMAATA